jgi:predicted  nucleic acid-binding Zn-ribbon protein
MTEREAQLERQLVKVRGWLKRLEAQAKREAAAYADRFPSLSAAARRDAANLAKVCDDIDGVLNASQGS